MRTAPEPLLARLEWRVVRRLDGRVAGGYRTAHRGTGTDLVGLREYTEGDDARHIDWNVTARLNEPQLRVFTEDRELTVWLVLDRSASMTVGGPDRGKHDVLSELALVLARLFGRGGNRVGALLYDTGLYDTGRSDTGRSDTGPYGTGPSGTGPSGTGRSGTGVVQNRRRRPPREHHDQPRGDARRGRHGGPAPRPDRGHLRLHRRRRLGPVAAAPDAAP